MPNPVGRPSEKPKDLVQRVYKYIKDCKDDLKKNIVNLPQVEDFALVIGFNKKTLYEWAKKDKEFSNALGVIKKEQRKRLINSGLAGSYNPTIAKLVLAANHGMSDKTEISGDQDKPLFTSIECVVVKAKD